MQNLLEILSRPTRKPAQCRGKSGMALVIVLGILSVMLIMGMSFSIIMRTERVAAANRVNDIRLRHLVHTALARAAADIAADLKDTNLKDEMAPDWQVIASTYVNTNGFTNFGLYAEDFTNPVAATFAIDTFHPILGKQTKVYTNVGLIAVKPTPNLPPAHASKFRNEMTNYVPRALWVEAQRENTNIYWQPVAFVNNLGFYRGSTRESVTITSVVGRVAYMILNCSGLWDANYIGGFSDAAGTIRYKRNTGVDNVKEVDLTAFREFETAAAADAFLHQRKNIDVRYDSLDDLFQNNLSAIDVKNYPSNLFVYSYARTGSWDVASSVVTGAVYLGTTNDIKASRVAIQRVFGNCGLSPVHSQWAYANLLGYLEPYPFVTEVCVRNYVTFTPSDANYRLDTEVILEVWWPYPAATLPAGQTISVGVTFDGTRKPANISPAQSHPIPDNTNAFKYVIRTLPTANCGGSPPDYRNATIYYSVVSPRAPGVVAFSNNVVVTLVGPWPGGTGPMNRSKEVVDPRFASEPSPTTWPSYPDLSSNRNDAMTAYRSANNREDEWDLIGCSLTNRLLTIGELGFIAYAPWATIDLTNSSHARVFDLFRVDTKTNYHGLFNPNSRDTNALSLAFMNMPIDTYPNQPSPDYVDDTDRARVIAENIIENGPYTNLSELASKDGVWKDIFAADEFKTVCINKPTREALIRNSFSLFNVRQNVFEILLAAEVAGIDGRFPLRPLRARAVAIVWRDPYTGAMFVRSIRHMQD